MKRIFIGTAFSGENEFDDCVNAIKSQKGINISQHFIVTGMGVLEALSTLYEKWNECKNQNDYFVQIDSDTVLKSDTILRDVIALLETDTKKNYIQTYVHDHITDTNVWGLNLYAPTVIFPKLRDRLFPDREPYGKSKFEFSRIPDSLKVTADHCPNPNEKQAFHFGWHRTIRQQNDKQMHIENAINRSIENQNVKHIDVMRYAALMGCKFAHAHMKSKLRDDKNVDYENNIFLSRFDEAKYLIREFQIKHSMQNKL